MRFAAAVALIVVLGPLAFPSEPGQPLDCSDWVFLEPGYTCVRLFGGAERPGSLSPIQSDNTGRILRFGPPALIGTCPLGAQIYRHPLEARTGDAWILFAYVDDRCVTSTTNQYDRFSPQGAISSMPFAPAIAFDAANGRMLLSLLSSCEIGGDCSAYPPGTGDYWVASISGFATMFEILQTFTPQPSLSFRVPYMPEGLPAADRFDTYWGPLTKPLDFTQAQPLQCDYPSTPPHVGDYFTVNDTLPDPAPGTGRYYVTAATYQGQTRYGRKTSHGHLSGRDPAVLPECVQSPTNR